MLQQVGLNELDSLKKVDWEGKLFLIEAAKVANIQKFIFFQLKMLNNFRKYSFNESKKWN
jgi:hypothetical protein